MRRGDEIEVFSNEEGSWFKAILEDTPPKSGTKKLNVSLLANDGSTTQKVTYLRFIRPIPPENLFTAVEFDEGCVVEASQRGGWWTGVVVKKITDEKVWVYFDSPPDLFQLKRSQLRQHFDWIRQEWVLSKKCTFRCGAMVEVNDNDVWVPSVIVKEMRDRKSFIVKPFKCLSWKDDDEAIKPNITLGLKSIRLTRLPVSVESYGLMESVEVFLEPGWRPGMVTCILCEKMYTVCLKATNESFVFKHEAIRPLEESVLVPDSNVDDSRKRKRGEVKHNPDLTTESVSPLTPSPARTVSALKQTETETQEITVHSVSNQSGLGNHTTGENEHNLSSTLGVEEKDTNTIVVLPFAKESLLWKELETMEVFQKAPPQSPHFSPLVGESEVFREGHAFGMMLTLSKLLENFKDLEPDVPISELKSLRVSFVKLETHGFNVSAPLARINKLLALKDRQLKTMEKQKGLDRQINGLREEFGQMQHKIIELERKQVTLEEQICRMESCARDSGIELDSLLSEFKATSSAPW